MSECRHYLIVREFCDTENSYVEDLRLLDEVFYKPLMLQKSKMLDDGLIAVFFSLVSQILALNTKFAEELSQRLNAWDGQNTSLSAKTEPLGQIFQKYVPLLDLYCEYAGSFYDVSARIGEYESSDEKLRSFLTAASLDTRCKGRTLQSFLITPIQRVPRYPLLLRELLKALADGHKSRKEVESALAMADRAARTIEVAMSERLEIDKLIRLQHKFDKDSCLVLAKPGRRLVVSDSVRRRGHRSERQYTFFLFSDLLIYADDSGGRFVSKAEFALHRCRADPAPLDRDPRAAYTLQFRSPEYSFEMMFPSKKEMKLWLSSLQRCIAASRSALPPPTSAASTSDTPASPKSKLLTETAEKTRAKEEESDVKQGNNLDDDNMLNSYVALPPKSEFAPIWSPNTPSCERCNKAFGFLFGSGRHHCRKCGRCVCASCSKKRASATIQARTRIAASHSPSRSPGGPRGGARHIQSSSIASGSIRSLSGSNSSVSALGGSGVSRKLAGSAKGKNLLLNETVLSLATPTTSAAPAAEAKAGEASEEGRGTGNKTLDPNDLSHDGVWVCDDCYQEHLSKGRGRSRTRSPRHTNATTTQAQQTKKNDNVDSSSNISNNPKRKNKVDGSDSKKTPRASKRPNERYLVAMDIKDSERLYVNSLRHFVNLVTDRLMYLDAESTSDLNLPPHMHVFLVCARQILRLNTKLLATLTYKMDNWYHQQHLGDVFKQFGPLFKVYREYASNYPQVSKTITTSYRFSKAISRCERHLDDGLTAEALMVLPMQRVPQYSKLLEQLQVATPKFHVDFEPLSQAVDDVRDALGCINRAIKDRNAMEVMSRIQTQVAGNVIISLFKTGRWLLREGKLKLIDNSSPNTPNTPKSGQDHPRDTTPRTIGLCMLYLFSDLIMLCLPNPEFRGSLLSKKNKPWQIHQCYSLRGVKVRGPGDLGFFGNETIDAGSFAVLGSREMYLKAKSPEEARVWADCIKAAIESFRKSSDDSKQR